MSDMNDTKDMVRMVVDSDSCIGAGQCEMLAPNTFLVDDDEAIAKVLEHDLLARSDAAEVAERCPGGAISFVEVESPADTDS